MFPRVFLSDRCNQYFLPTGSFISHVVITEAHRAVIPVCVRSIRASSSYEFTSGQAFTTSSSDATQRWHFARLSMEQRKKRKSRSYFCLRRAFYPPLFLRRFKLRMSWKTQWPVHRSESSSTTAFGRRAVTLTTKNNAILWNIHCVVFLKRARFQRG